MLVIFLFAIDGTVVSAAMPTIVGKLGGLELYSWVFSAYMLTSALSTPLFGNLSDLYGRRRLMLIGIGLFTLGSALCGMAQTIEQLVVFRAVQGLGGGAIYALSFIIIGFLFPPEKRAQMQALISGLWGIASILGPLAGGVLTLYWSWRWIFFINPPLCLIAAVLIGLGVSEAQAEGRRRPDLKGAATLLIGLFFLFYALEQGQRNAFDFDGILSGLLVAAGAALYWFYRIERRASEPILPPALFRLRLFGICLALSWLASMGMFGVITYLPLYVQGALEGDAAHAGLSLVLASLGWTAGSFIAAPGMNRLGYRAVSAAGMLLMVFGYGWFIAAADRLGFFSVLAVGSLIGVGMGMVSITTMVAAQNTTPREQLGAATSTVMLSRMLGGAFGIALMGSVLVGRMERRLIAVSFGAFDDVGGGLLKKLANPQNLLDPATRDLIPESFRAFLVEILAGSVRHAFLAGFFVMLVGLVVSFFMSPSTPADANGERKDRATL
ncbi:MAG TPA: MDR family MFS transporter [Candidatus Binatia bacterium]|jgi:EmrB/QacA subfamily drug resistance transporter